MNIHINRSRYAAKRITRIDCLDAKCRKNVFAVSFFQHWYGWNTTCLNCGRQYEDSEMVRLEFSRGVRKENIKWAKDTWRRHTELTNEIDLSGIA